MAAPKLNDVIAEVTARIGGRSAAARGRGPPSESVPPAAVWLVVASARDG